MEGAVHMLIFSFSKVEKHPQKIYSNVSYVSDIKYKMDNYVESKMFHYIFWYNYFIILWPYYFFVLNLSLKILILSFQLTILYHILKVERHFGSATIHPYPKIISFLFCHN